MVLAPDLLKTLAEMGHGDRIVLGDAYFASAAMAEDVYKRQRRCLPAAWKN